MDRRSHLGLGGGGGECQIQRDQIHLFRFWPFFFESIQFNLTRSGVCWRGPEQWIGQMDEAYRSLPNHVVWCVCYDAAGAGTRGSIRLGVACFFSF